MNWNDLLSKERLGDPIEIPYGDNKYKMSEFEKDYWRIIDCPAFRRLQDKTQVFPLDRGDFVRTRLTHSLEVASLAKQLVTMIYRNIKDSNSAAFREIKEAYPFTAENAQCAADIAACAGLLHDIGNPPFGHFGEDVVHAWFENNLDKLTYIDHSGKVISLKQEELIADLKHFEGNAQAFRLLTKLHSVDSEYGLNLTIAVLNTLVKYPTDSRHIDADAENVCLHKLGYYEADKELFSKVAELTGTYFDNTHHRHPLTFILEAADDIAYATADLEDSYKKGLFTIDDFVAFYQKRLSEITDTSQYKYSKELIDMLEKYRAPDGERVPSSELQAMQRWINYSRHWLLYCAAYGFKHNYKDIMEGNFYSEIISDTFHEGTVSILKDTMCRFTFCSSEIVKLELSAEEIIENLLKRFVPAAINWDVSSKDRDTKLKSDKKLMSLVSENHKAAYHSYKKSNDDEYNLYLRLLLIADFVSGMTDTYAKTLYQELNGI